MVYRGRPSTGCKKCRERKIKCDERPEGCLKCAEKRIPCPGYDRTVDAFFHDETATVQARARKAKAKAIAARDARDQQDSKTSLLPVKRHESPGLYMTDSLSEQGITFYMAHYSMGVDKPPAHSEAYHKHLSTDGFNPLVATSMTALGIAGISNLYSDPALKREATRQYLNAIQMANAAISSPRTAKSDSTLIAVNLLGMFEATFNEFSLAGWSNHVNGAASLIKLRGMEQFSTPAGQRMYFYTISLLTMNCMGQGRALPPYVRKMNSKARTIYDDKDPRAAFFFLHMEVIDLRAKIKNEKTMSLVDIIHEALQLDAVAVSIFQGLGPEWQYEEVPCYGQDNMYEDFYAVYPSHICVQIHNWTRYIRIYLHDIIRNSILAGFATLPPTLVGSIYYNQLSESTRLLYKFQSDILATMPQYLHDVPGYVPYRTNPSNSPAASQPNISPGQFTPTAQTSYMSTPPPTPPSAQSSPAPSVQSDFKALHENFRDGSPTMVQELVGNDLATCRVPIPRVTGAYSTTWAMYIAGSMPIASPKSQDFVYMCLRRIELEFGIKQAKVLAMALKMKRRLDNDGASEFELCPSYLPPVNGQYVPPKTDGPDANEFDLPPPSSIYSDNTFGAEEDLQPCVVEEIDDYSFTENFSIPLRSR